MQESIVFYKSFYEAIRELEPELQVEIYNALFDYGFEGIENNLSPIAKAVFTLIKPQIDANARKKEQGKINGQKGAEFGKLGAEFGKLGGRPRKARIDAEKEETNGENKPPKNPPKTPQEDEKTPSNVNVNDNVNDIKEKVKRENADYQKIVDLYNEICISFPRLKSLSDSRKKAIKARMKVYSIDDFRRMFEKAESSRFLKGGNNRNWMANFDWMIKDANMAKILDGNYDSNGSNDARAKPNSFANFPQNSYNFDELEAVLIDN